MQRRLIFALLAASLSAGCSTTGRFENRVVFTPDCKRGFLASLYGPLGLTTEIEAADVVALCRRETAQAKKD